MKLYSAWYCPFAQRVEMGLIAKGAPYRLIEVDPYQKTEDWMRISCGIGQVPVVVDDKTEELRVPGSLRALEFVDDAASGAKLFPTDPGARARSKYWSDFQERAIIPFFYRFLKSPSAGSDAQAAKASMEKGLREFSAAMAPEGPFFLGETLSVVDVAFAPFAYRIDLLLQRYRDYQTPQSGSLWRRYQDWFAAVSQSAPFRQTSSAPGYVERLIAFYEPYSKGGGQADVTMVR